MRQLLSALLGVFLMTSCSLGHPPKAPEPDPSATLPLPGEDAAVEITDEPDGTGGPIHRRPRKATKKPAVAASPLVESPLPEPDPCKSLVAESPAELVEKKLDCMIQNPRLLK